MDSAKIVQDAIEIAARAGQAPEQGDFMTAAILNRGSMTPQERRWLQQDLIAAERGTSSEGLGSSWGGEWDEEETEPYEEFYDPDPFDAPSITVFVEPPNLITAGCINSTTWYEQHCALEAEIPALKERIKQAHAQHCGCGLEPDIDVKLLL